MLENDFKTSGGIHNVPKSRYLLADPISNTVYRIQVGLRRKICILTRPRDQKNRNFSIKLQ